MISDAEIRRMVQANLDSLRAEDTEKRSVAETVSPASCGYCKMSDSDIRKAIAHAMKSNGVDFPVTYEWSNRLTATIGKAFGLKRHIILSLPLFQRCDAAEHWDTVVHEVCHLIIFEKFRTGGHGRNWKNAMRACGLAPKRCHNVDNSGLRKKGGVLLKCKCRDSVELGTVRTRRVLTGERFYSCRRCKALLLPVDDLLRERVLLVRTQMQSYWRMTR